MALNAIKTEHSGAKKGRGAFWGPKCTAKHDSKKKRRAISKSLIKEA